MPGKSASGSSLVSAPIIRPYMPELESLPGIACLAVLLLHSFAWQYSGLLKFSKFRIYDKVWAHYFPQLQPADWRFDLVVLRFVVGGGVATGIAFLSRRYYEEIFLRMKEKFTPRSRSPKISADPLVTAVAASE